MNETAPSRTTVARRVAALCGVLAAAAAMAAGELVAALVGPRAAPILAVAGVVIDHTPPSVKDVAIRLFGTADKAVLVGIVTVLLVALAALVGVVGRSRPWAGTAGIGLLAVVGAAAAVSRPNAAAAAVSPAVVGAVVGAVVLVVLLRSWRNAPPRGPLPEGAPSEEPRPDPASEARAGFDRRRFVVLAAATAAASAGGGLAGRWLGGARVDAVMSREAVSLPAPASPAGPVPPGADLRLPGLSPFITSNSAFYRVDTALTTPRLDATRWRLRLRGLGVTERSYDYADLLARSDLVERDITLACVSNPVGGPYVGNARWIGVPLAALLEEAGVRPPGDGGPADQLVSRSSDGMTIGTPLADVMDGRDAMLALGMNGEPLPVEHGFPVRMVVPGMYGYVSACKWLVELELTTFDAFDAYWIPRGWASRAPVKTQSRVDTPRAGERLEPGVIPVAGVAWAQGTGIAAVEVRIDGGRWRRARLAAEDTADTWRQWVLEWEATPGPHRVTVRAVDRDGDIQPGTASDPAPDGATGRHTVEVEVG